MECVIALNLIDVYSIPVLMEDTASTKEKLAQLEAKAAEMKAAAEKKAKM